MTRKRLAEIGSNVSAFVVVASFISMLLGFAIADMTLVSMSCIGVVIGVAGVIMAVINIRRLSARIR